MIPSFVSASARNDPVLISSRPKCVRKSQAILTDWLLVNNSIKGMPVIDLALI
jgi:hypothetical protein